MGADQQQGMLIPDDPRPKKGDSFYENTRWCNRDLIPMPPERRTWGIWGYFGQYSCLSQRGDHALRKMQVTGPYQGPVYQHGRRGAPFWLLVSAHNKRSASWYVLPRSGLQGIMLIKISDCRRSSHRSAGRRMWLDGRDSPYRLHCVVPVLLGHARQLLPRYTTSIRCLHVVRVSNVEIWDLIPLTQANRTSACKPSGEDKPPEFYGAPSFPVCQFTSGRDIPILTLFHQGFAHLKNSFSESSHLMTNDFIGLVIWMIAFIPLVLVPPERLQMPFAISFVLFASSCFGLLIWYGERRPPF